MAIEFEDMPQHDWPDDVRTLRQAAAFMYDAYSELDYAITSGRLGVNADAAAWRGPYLDLAGRAWALLRDLRAAGLARLAEVETEQTEEASQ